jgi:hypothetical protein
MKKKIFKLKFLFDFHRLHLNSLKNPMQLDPQSLVVSKYNRGKKIIKKLLLKTNLVTNTLKKCAKCL